MSGEKPEASVESETSGDRLELHLAALKELPAEQQQAVTEALEGLIPNLQVMARADDEARFVLYVKALQLAVGPHLSYGLKVASENADRLALRETMEQGPGE